MKRMVLTKTVSLSLLVSTSIIYVEISINPQLCILQILFVLAFAYVNLLNCFYGNFCTYFQKKIVPKLNQFFCHFIFSCFIILKSYLGNLNGRDRELVKKRFKKFIELFQVTAITLVLVSFGNLCFSDSGTLFEIYFGVAKLMMM